MFRGAYVLWGRRPSHGHAVGMMGGSLALTLLGPLLAGPRERARFPYQHLAKHDE